MVRLRSRIGHSRRIMFLINESLIDLKSLYLGHLLAITLRLTLLTVTRLNLPVSHCRNLSLKDGAVAVH